MRELTKLNSPSNTPNMTCFTNDTVSVQPMMVVMVLSGGWSAVVLLVM